MTGNYGWAIVFLTMAINFALYPLTLSSIVQMAAIQKIQPKLTELQKKHKDKPDQLQKEMMELYKKEKVNPFGGCLPMILKIPFFIALFYALQSKEFTTIISQPGINSSFLWISNLSKPDPTYILIILIAITTYLSQKTMPASNNQQMAGMTYIMPFMIAFISIAFPSGVQIYWVVSNLVAVAQQWYIVKKIEKKNVSRETF
ncbi:MAG: YidC/Oxa1 family membrane protein insertase [Candidatus Margulisiibacteriota bacterium]